MLSRPKTIGLLLGVVSAVLYGVYPATARAVYTAGGNAMFMLLATSVTRALAVWLFCVCKKKPVFVTKEDRQAAFVGGFFQAVCNLGVFASLVYLPGPVTIAIIFTHTLMQLLYMAWRKEVKLDIATLMTTLMALFGITLVLDVWHDQKLSWLGIGLAVIGAAACAVRMYVLGKQTQARNPAVVGAEAFSVAAFLISVFALFWTPALPTTLTAYGWATLGSATMALGTLTMLYGIAFLGAFSFSMIIKLEPIFTAIFSLLFIGEILAWQQYIGIAVVIGSLAAYQYIDHHKTIRRVILKKMPQ